MIKLTYFVRMCEGTMAPDLASNDGASCAKMVREHSHRSFLFFVEKVEIYSSENEFIFRVGRVERGWLGSSETTGTNQIMFVLKGIQNKW